MKKSVMEIAAVVVALLSISVGFGYLDAQNHATSPDHASAKVQIITTHPAAFKAALIDMLKQTVNHDGNQHEHHARLHAVDGPWGKILAERDAILAEGLGPNYKSNSQLPLLEVEVLYNLGKLDIIRNYDAFEKARAGKAHSTK